MSIREHRLAKLAQTCTGMQGTARRGRAAPVAPHPSNAKPRVTRGPQGLPFPALMSQGTSIKNQKEHTLPCGRL